MRKTSNNEVVENLLHVNRIIHRNLLRRGLEGADESISRPLFLIMPMLRERAMRVS